MRADHESVPSSCPRAPVRPGRPSPRLLGALLLAAVAAPDGVAQWLAPAGDEGTSVAPAPGTPPPGAATGAASVAPSAANPAPVRLRRLDDDEDDVVVTASRSQALRRDLPYSTSVIDGPASALSGQDGRSLPNALTREPSVLLQKTGPGQSSPFIRGWTGFRTLWLVDGIRLNNSVWRSGPNQYAGTVDIWATDRFEVVRGPGSALWGSDAIGGVLNARTTPGQGQGWQGLVGLRWASAEDSAVLRLGFEGGDAGGPTVKGGVTLKDFGTLHAGGDTGDLPDTDYSERAVDLRVDVPLADNDSLTFGYQHVRQSDVPRTHKTVSSKPFHGTTVGSDLHRDLDQGRDLLYGRWTWDGESGALADGGELTLSWHHQQQHQDRLRIGDRRSATGFDVRTLGVQAQMHRELGSSLVTWGADWYHDDVDSFRRDVIGGVPQPAFIQGPVGDDASYDLFGAYVQAEIPHGEDVETIVGVRWTQAHAVAHQVDDPTVAGSSPSTPGNILRVDETFNDWTGNLRTLIHLDERTTLHAGLAQGFRAPNLSDLTSDLEDSGVESPSPDLEPEEFLSAELGVRTEQEDWNGELTVWHTWVDDLIVRSPTGGFVGTTPIFRKDNASEGTLWGIELRGDLQLCEDASFFAVASWMDGEVDQFTAGGAEVKGPPDRLMPLTATTGVRYEPVGEDYWLQVDVFMADEADELSLRDQSDTERIPPGGTPGFGVLGLRGGRDLGDGLRVFAALENILDKDYRIHGSGQNEPGRGVVAGFTKRF